MKLKDIPTIGNQITKQDEVIIDQIGGVINAITEKMKYISFTDSVIILSGIVHGLLKYREEVASKKANADKFKKDLMKFVFLIIFQKNK